MSAEDKGKVVVMLLMAALFGLACMMAGCLHLQPVKKVQTQPLRLGARMASNVVSTQSQCAAYDRRVVGMTIGAVVAGVLSGGASTFETVTGNKTAVYSLAGASVGLAAGGAVMTYLATYYAKKYADQCTVNVGGK